MRTALITGASSGIGAQVARELDKQNISTVLIGRNQERLNKTASELKHCKKTISCDLSKVEEIKILPAILDNYNFDILINNAGVYLPQTVDDDTDNVWFDHFQINLMSAVRLTRLLWPKLCDNSALIINVSSTLALRPIPGAGAYSALKAAMNSWTQTLALEGAAHGVRALAVCPGLVNTPIHNFHGKEDSQSLAILEQLKNLQPIPKVATASDIATVIEGLCSEKMNWLTGNIIPVDGGNMLTSKDI